MVKEFSNVEEVTSCGKKYVEGYEERFNNSFKSVKGKWGKRTVCKDESIGNNKIIIDINEECISDIVNELYSPIAIATIECIVSIIKTFSSVFKNCKKSFDKIYDRWFEDNKGSKCC